MSAEEPTSIQPSEPKIRAFQYLMVPADRTAAVEVRHFNGATEADLRKDLVGHFAANSMSDGQRAEMKMGISAEAEKNRKKATAKAESEEKNDDEAVDEATKAQAEAQKEAQIAAMLEIAVGSGSYEIVPVMLPNRANKFIGTSLYIDDAGRFKELPLNERASRMAQKDIRGDAFVLSNHDDPALEDWGRVDCPLERFESILANPKQATPLDTSNQAAMAAASAAREYDTKIVTAEEAQEAMQSKADGNTAFGNQDYKKAAELYELALTKLMARTDLLENGAELETARIACFSNQSLCFIKLGDGANAHKAASMVAYHLDPTNHKAWFRLATANLMIKEFDAARRALQQCLVHGSGGQPTPDSINLLSQIDAAEAAYTQAEKKRYSKMFA